MIGMRIPKRQLGECACGSQNQLEGYQVIADKLTRDAVLKTLAEFDELGRELFLSRYKFGKAKSYFLVHDGKPYDSKAIAGVAQKHLGERALTTSDFSGGEVQVARGLRELGFEVTGPDAPFRLDIPFKIGQVYHRKSEIHAPYGGQERGGIATPVSVPFVFLFTGESGGAYGYEDGWQEDGSFDYTGEGQVGDMEMKKGNRAIFEHAKDGKELLLFEAAKKKGFHQFKGVFSCAGYKFSETPDRENTVRKSIVFSLVPTAFEANVQEAEFSDIKSTLDINQLRNLAYDKGTDVAVTDTRPSVMRYRRRSAAVKAYVLLRAAGSCECCEMPAPFLKRDGSPYLEPHHTARLADGGADLPDAVAAICPTCHRHIHHGEGGVELNEQLTARIKQKERQLRI